MTDRGLAVLSLEFLSEASLLLYRNGEILNANGAARRLFDPEPIGRNLFDFVASDHEDLAAYLRRAGGSTAPIVGALSLRTPEGPVRLRLHCAAVADGAGGRALVLRCLARQDNEFSVLTGRLRELTAELHARLQRNAGLEEALRQNQGLLRELQHRVKNNIQMMASLLQMSARGNQGGEVAKFTIVLRHRLQAMASAQEAIYRSTRPETIAAGPMLEELVTSVAHGFGAPGNVRTEIADAELSHDTAHAIALILNELLTNAIKHGLRGHEGTIVVIFRPLAEGFELAVRDDGPGLPADAARRSSGLKLVRALCRQIGGMLATSSDNGGKCSVRFKGSAA
ncbi:MAG: histidine kinase dimerization/phosphoacceptor domain -containing protein [Acetobacterales bacterium]